MAITDRPWELEPNRVEFEASGLPCLIIRASLGRHLCGYVGIQPGHPWYERWPADDVLQVHGGITWVGTLRRHSSAPCGRTWWLGFDCCHVGDAQPREFGPFNVPHGEYRTVAYVEAQCEELARQCVDMGRVGHQAKPSRLVRHFHAVPESAYVEPAPSIVDLSDGKLCRALTPILRGDATEAEMAAARARADAARVEWSRRVRIRLTERAAMRQPAVQLDADFVDNLCVEIEK
jgi:hypothetical protein